MIEIKTVGEDIKVNIEGEGEELLQEFTHLIAPIGADGKNRTL